MHLVRYKPLGTEPPDYFVAYHNGMSLVRPEGLEPPTL